ncbi:TPA: hypothetical protein ACHIGN_000112 [Enterococcus faecium]|uniref:hypothetical protein n=1 Tax=Enterococcus casseliflavus TaxID=37734 RepID=UPI0019FEFD32|nr:hypothetical protein [Enterococcus casseliflavus]EMF0128654.1 hypothetical protein [Enterococcus hirae]EMF0208527.1 hypothetical protein [Enterococcus hirae]EMF0226500.1 hypothetical protein [Enterococcus hirae]
MKNVDMEIYNYVKERLNKEVSVSFESINILEYDAILIQIIIKSGRKKIFIHYDYEHVKSLDDIKSNLDDEIDYFKGKYKALKLF